MSDQSDETLMSRYQGGDAAAFDALYARYRAPLYRYVERLTNDGAVAEELYQEVWMRLIRARRQWRQEMPFRPWLYRIAHNRVIDHWRTLRNDRVALDEERVVALEHSWPEAWLAIQECVERLFKLLGALSEPQRTAFLLKEEAGLSLAEIVQVTGAGRETVKSRLRYAIRSLRRGLEGCDESV